MLNSNRSKEGIWGVVTGVSVPLVSVFHILLLFIYTDKANNYVTVTFLSIFPSFPLSFSRDFSLIFKLLFTWRSDCTTTTFSRLGDQIQFSILLSISESTLLKASAIRWRHFNKILHSLAHSLMQESFGEARIQF